MRVPWDVGMSDQRVCWDCSATRLPASLCNLRASLGGSNVTLQWLTGRMPVRVAVHRCMCIVQCMDGACMRGARVAHGFGCVCVPQVMGRGAPMGVCAACICGIELMR